MPLTSEFKELRKNVRLNYFGKPVPKKYQSKYGKKYNLNDVNSLSYAIAKSKGIKTD